LIIAQAGWRFAYNFVGIIGACLGIISLVFLRDPKRNAFGGPQKPPSP